MPLSDSDIAALQARTDLKTADGKSFTVTQVTPRPSGGIEVLFSAADATVTEEQVELALKKLPAISNPLGANPDVKATKSTAQAHARTFDGGGAVRRLPSNEIRLLQARLCMPEAARDGVWGPATQQALERDRAARDKSRPIPTGTLTDKERDQLLALKDGDASARCAQRAGK